MDDTPDNNTEAIRTELEKVLASRTFRSAQGQRAFLRYVAEEAIAGRGHLIKEYIIGIEAFGRGESFDPRLDPIVRTQAAKLRAKLARYYETEGENDTMRIEFRKGSYVPSFRLAGVPCNRPAESTVAITAASENVTAADSPSHVNTRRWNWRIVAISAALLMLAGSGYVAFQTLRSGWPDTVRGSRGPSVAVMPFVNLSDNQEEEFLSDGLTEELIDSLRHMPGLQVAARTSAFQFKGKPVDIRAVAQTLHVRAVLTGSVRRVGNRLRIAVELANATDNSSLWSGSYDRNSIEAQAVEREITKSVTERLGFRVAGADASVLRKTFPSRASTNPAAYRDYLKGLYFWNKLTVEGLQKAMRYFQQAIAEDPAFASAYAALADCYVMAPQVATAPPPEVVSKIEAAARRALELDSTLGDAHFDLAICAEYQFDWATAEKEFWKGLKLSPGRAVGHLWYAKYLALTGRKDEVLVERRIAADLDPVSPYAVQAVAGYLSVVGRYDEAIEQFRGALALEPNFGLAHQGLGVTYLLKGMTSEAIEELQMASRLMAGPRRLALLGYAYAVSGRTAEARQILNGFLDQAKHGAFPALAIAEIYIGLGEKDRAFQWLERAVDQKDLDVTLQWDSPFEPLRSDPRFARLLRRMKLA